MKKQLAEEGLTHRYNNDPELALQARMIVAMAFVPLGSVNEAINTVADEVGDELAPVVLWFERYYIGRLNRNGTRRPPIFPQRMWSCHERVLNSEPRTNNYAEAGHRRLQIELAVDHPSLWSLVTSLKRIQKKHDKVYEEMIGCRPAPPKRRVYRRADERILSRVNAFATLTMLEFLRGISHNFEMNA